MNPGTITSKDNAWVKRLRLLASDGSAYRKHGQVWLEGEHLSQAALAQGWQPQAVVATPAGQAWVAAQRLPATCQHVCLSDALMRSVSGLESAPAVGLVLALPVAQPVQAHVPTVVLDRLQDPGNVGSIVRTAAALGFKQVLALKGTVGLWSPKVLRAGMGAHFAVQLIEGLAPSAVADVQVPLLATSSHQGQWLHQAALPWPCAWLLGHEGQGVTADLAARAAHTVRIAQPGGQESLNVAAAAAICLYASAVRR